MYGVRCCDVPVWWRRADTDAVHRTAAGTMNVPHTQRAAIGLVDNLIERVEDYEVPKVIATVVPVNPPGLDSDGDDALEGTFATAAMGRPTPTAGERGSLLGLAAVHVSSPLPSAPLPAAPRLAEGSSGAAVEASRRARPALQLPMPALVSAVVADDSSRRPTDLEVPSPLNICRCREFSNILKGLAFTIRIGSYCWSGPEIHAAEQVLETFYYAVEPQVCAATYHGSPRTIRMGSHSGWTSHMHGSCM